MASLYDRIAAQGPEAAWLALADRGERPADVRRALHAPGDLPGVTRVPGEIRRRRAAEDHVLDAAHGHHLVDESVRVEERVRHSRAAHNEHRRDVAQRLAALAADDPRVPSAGALVGGADL